MIERITERWTTQTVSLRAATPGDCERVWEWNFAPDVRASSVSSHVVSLEQHTTWYAQRLAAADSPMWIVDAGGLDAGVVRIEGGVLSIALAIESRGFGIGKRAIAAACATWGRPVLAHIRCHNHASRACFEACGFVLRAEAAELVTYHWSP